MPDIAIPDLIRQEATKQGIPPELALAVAQQESSFNPTAIGQQLPSGERAQGTFQILPSTAKGLGIDPTDPTQNIQGGVKYLRQLMDQHQGDLDKVLASYGGVKTDTTYVPQVRARIAKFQQPQAPAAPAVAPTMAVSHGAPPEPRNYQRLVSAKTGASRTTDANAPTGPGDFGGLDPRTPEGQRNIAGGIGAIAMTAAAPEVPVLGGLVRMAPRIGPVVASILGSFGGGATAQAGQDVAAGKMPTVGASTDAGIEQAKNELIGQTGGWAVRAGGRAVMAKKVGRDISTGLADALEATKSRLTQGQGVPAVSPSKAGQLVHDVAFDGGPTATVKDRLGSAVGDVAKAGPALATAPLKERLAELAEQVSPAIGHQPTGRAAGGALPKIPGYSAAQVAELARKNPDILGVGQAEPDVARFVGLHGGDNGIVSLEFDRQAPVSADDIRRMFPNHPHLEVRKFDSRNSVAPHLQKFQIDVFDAQGRLSPTSAKALVAEGGGKFHDWPGSAAPGANPASAAPPAPKALSSTAPTVSAGGQLTTLPPDHPLPGVLDQIRTALEGSDTIPFEDAHKIKRLLDDAVNWDSPAKKQAQQITKGFRLTLREQMAAHEPYNQATDAYAKVAQLYTKPVQTLHREILSNPEGLVEKVDWKHPSQAALLKNLTVDASKQAGDAGAQQGEAAWNAVRAAYVRDKLIAKGPAAMNAEIARMRATGNGQEFIQTMFGDPQGSTVLKNIEQLGSAWQNAATNVEKFNQTGLAHAQGPAQAVGDMLSVTMHGHPIMGLRAGARLVMGPHAKEMVEWASRSDARTQFVIKHVLTGPDPGMAVADFSRWLQSSQEAGSEPDQPSPSHVTPPPQPRAIPTGGQ